MKITCNHCGEKNELGRMFCMACGKRMTITNADITQAATQKKAFNAFALVKPIILVALLALVVTALIPARPAVLTPADESRARETLKAKYGRLVLAARAKQPARESFNTAELNVYMKARLSGATNSPVLLNLQVERDRLIVLQTFQVKPVAKAMSLTFTRRLVCGANGRVLAVRGASFGRLPLPGPLKAFLAAPIAETFALTVAEQTVEKQLSEILIRDGKLEIAVAP
jgi:hypothetical protein